MLPEAGARVKWKMQVERAAAGGVYFPTPFLMDKPGVWVSTTRLQIDLQSMNNDKKNKAAVPAKKTAPAAPSSVPPLFRRIDWLALIITFAAIWAVYLWTLAPEVTLEDSGELCTGSYYAGIPHPPGYPFWAIYSWFWTFILPIGNVAWRVEVGQSFAAAMGCGLLALMVSRGSSMMIEGIEDLKDLAREWENAICLVSGFVAGTLLGLDVFMWSESVVINRISVFGVPWLIGVMACLMRWIYAPQQRRYLYLAMFLYGLCATIHQTLLLSAMGVEVLIAAVQPKLGRDLFLGNSIIYFVCLMLMNTVPALQNMSSIEQVLFHIVGISSILAGGWLAVQTKGMFSEWKAVGWMGVLWVLGVSFYLYEPVSGMTVPPMQWGYPRTVEGFFHALSRGQYETATGLNIFQNPSRFAFQLGYIIQGLADSFSWVYMFVGLLPFLFIMKMHKRERSWIIGLTSIYFCLSVLLVILLDVTPDRSTSELNKVFFTASHALFALMIGYGLTLMSAYMATHYQKFRRWGLIGGGVMVVLAIYCLVDAAGKLYFGPAGEISLSQLPHSVALAFNKNQYGLPVFASLVLIAIPVVFIAALLAYRQRAPLVILLGLVCIMPLWSGMTHWYKSEQRNHWFGYWFGHDMFTPPFLNPKTGKLTYDNTLRAELLKDPKNAKLIYPEMARDAVVFGGTDPGRFCPTYMIFCESFIPHRCQPKQDQKFDRRDCYLITQNALADGTYLDYLRSQYNRSKQVDPPFFSELSQYLFGLVLGPANADSGIFALVNKTLYYTLDVPFTKWGKYVETYRRKDGVYPPHEIYIPSPDDSQKCFQDYTDDVARRAQLNQLAPGENVHVENGRVQVSGQVAVMKINGLLCKVIFDNCPSNEFYVEESFPLDWMYPYETPFSDIMKINRQPVTELTQAMFDLDHKFWSDNSARLCGNWITYDTSISNICDFVERTYIHNNYQGYTGDRAFVRDDDAQKAFSKLRSSQAGMYAWRCFPRSPQNPSGCPPEFAQKSPASQAALIREADFAFKQAFAFCPYSPEAVYRYVNFLMQFGRFDDAILIAQTCQKLDPYNDQITGLIKTIQDYKAQSTTRAQTVSQVNQMEATARTNPADVHNLISLGVTYAQMQQTNRAVELFDQALASPNIKYPDAGAIAGYYSQLGNIPKLERALEKLVALAPDQPEPHYDLAALEAYLGQTAPALTNLTLALDLSARRLKTNPAARNLLTQARGDAHLNSLRSLPEFQKLVPPQ
jgi:tetratricopeptide (TPR) repeat protein